MGAVENLKIEKEKTHISRGDFHFFPLGNLSTVQRSCRGGYREKSNIKFALLDGDDRSW